MNMNILGLFHSTINIICLKHLDYKLVGSVQALIQKIVTQGNFIAFLQKWIFVNIRINVEEDRHVNLFTRIQSLFFKTKTLDFVEICTSFKWHNIIGRNSINGFLCGIPSSIKGQSSFSWMNVDDWLLWFEIPSHLSSSVSVESYRQQPFFRFLH